MELPATFGEFLTWIGSSAVIGSVISWLVAHWGWFQRQGGLVKVMVLMAIATAMGAVSTLSLQYVPAGVIEAVQPYYSVVLNAAIIVLSAQGYNYLVNERAQRRAEEQETVSDVNGLREEASG